MCKRCDFNGKGGRKLTGQVYRTHQRLHGSNWTASASGETSRHIRRRVAPAPAPVPPDAPVAPHVDSDGVADLEPEDAHSSSSVSFVPAQEPHTSHIGTELADPIDIDSESDHDAQPPQPIDPELFDYMLQAALEQDPFYQRLSEDEEDDQEDMELQSDEELDYNTLIENLITSTANHTSPTTASHPEIPDPLSTFSHRIHPSLLHVGSEEVRSDGDDTNLNFFAFFVATIAQVLKSAFNTPVKAINFVIQAGWLLSDASYQAGIEEGERRALRRSQGRTHPSGGALARPDRQETDSDTSPSPSLGQPQTIRTFQVKLGFRTQPLVHPCCPNKNCHHVFHEITDVNSFKDLPRKCHICAQPLFCHQDEDKPLTLAYP